MSSRTIIDYHSPFDRDLREQILHCVFLYRVLTGYFLINFLITSTLGKCRRRTTSRYCCAFPFIYKGRRYNSCTRRRHSRPWCALTPNYDRDKKWGNCARGDSLKICLYFCSLKNLNAQILFCCCFPCRPKTSTTC